MSTGTYARYSMFSSVGAAAGVSSLNGLVGNVTISAGSGIALTPSGNNIAISTTGAGSGTVTSVSVVSANGLAGTVATATTTPAITLSTTVTGVLLGNGTSISASPITGTGSVVLANSPTLTGTLTGSTANFSGAISASNFSGSSSGTNTGDQTITLTGDITGSGTGSFATTLATVNGNVGSFTNAAITVNAKGLITAASSGSVGNLTDVGTDGITVTGGTGAVLGAGASLSQHVADATHNGYLSSADWNTFNNSSGAAITSLTGDGTATGPGAAALTLATVNGNVGSFGSSTSIPSFTVNAKGLITAASGNVVIAPAGTLTGTTLASNVVTSSLTSLGVQSVALNLGSNQITNVLDPTTAQMAATKNYVDMSVAALQPLASVYAATVGSNIPGTYLNGAAGVGATFTTTSTATFTLDGTTPPLNSRILIKDQSSGFQNGVYAFTAAPVGGVSGSVFTRTLDYDTASDMNSAGLIPVINGTVNALSSWQQVAFITTVGTDSLVFSEFTANPSLYLLKANNLSDVASASASFNNLSPMTTAGDIIYENATPSGARLGIGSTGNVLTVIAGLPSWAPPATSGTVTSVSVVSANGLAGTVATSTTTPAITLSTTITGILQGNGTAISAATTTGTGSVVLSASPTLTGTITAAAANFSGAISASNFSGSSSGTNTGDQTITLTGDVTGSGTGSFATTLATVNSNVGSFGSSTSIPSFTVNGKGLITAASGNVVIAPAGTLSGTTLNSTVVSSSLTSVGTIATGVWNASVIPSTYVGLGRTINAQTGTTYTFVLADGSAAGGNPLVTASNASAQTYTVPTNASVAFPVGTQIDVMGQGAGKVTIAGAGGVTVNSKAGNLSISAQYVGVSLIKTATDVWTLLGDLVA